MILIKNVTQSNLLRGVLSLAGISKYLPSIKGYTITINNLYKARINSVAYRIDGLTSYYRDNNVNVGDLLQIEINEDFLITKEINIKLMKNKKEILECFLQKITAKDNYKDLIEVINDLIVRYPNITTEEFDNLIKELFKRASMDSELLRALQECFKKYSEDNPYI